MKVNKKILAWVLMGVVMVSIVGYTGTLIWKSNTQTPSSKEVVIAEVAGMPIYKSALDEQMEYVKQTLMMYYGEDYASDENAMAYYKAQEESILQYLVEVQVLVQKAAEEGVVVSDEEVEDALELVKAQFETEEAFETGLEEEGMTLEELKVVLKENLIVAAMITKYTEDVTVSDEEVEDYYNTYKAAYYTIKPGANMSHIIVETEEEAQEVKAAYDAGESFEDLAAAHSMDSTKDYGGSLGYIAYDDAGYDADFLAAAKLLQEGEVSEPVQTQFGWHIIKVTGVTEEEEVTPLEDVRDEIYNTLLDEKQYNVLMDHLEEWKQQMDVVTYEDRLA